MIRHPEGMLVCELEEEIERLHDFVLRLAERLANASDVLTKLAERKDRRKHNWEDKK